MLGVPKLFPSGSAPSGMNVRHMDGEIEAMFSKRKASYLLVFLTSRRMFHRRCTAISRLFRSGCRTWILCGRSRPSLPHGYRRFRYARAAVCSRVFACACESISIASHASRIRVLSRSRDCIKEGEYFLRRRPSRLEALLCRSPSCSSAPRCTLRSALLSSLELKCSSRLGGEGVRLAV